MTSKRGKYTRISKLFDKDGKLVSQQIAKSVNSFLKEHWKKIDFENQTIKQYILQNKLLIEPEVIQELKKIQRIFKFSPNSKAMGILIEHNLHSAYEITQIPKKSFIALFKDIVSGEATITNIYHIAQKKVKQERK